MTGHYATPGGVNFSNPAGLADDVTLATGLLISGDFGLQFNVQRQSRTLSPADICRSKWAFGDDNLPALSRRLRTLMPSA